MKENNGRGARRRVWYRLLGVLGCLVCLGMSLLVVLEAFTAILIPQAAQQQQGGTSASEGGGGVVISAQERHARFRRKWRQQQLERQEAEGGGAATSSRGDGMAKEVLLNEILEGKLQLTTVIPNLDWLRRNRPPHQQQQNTPEQQQNTAGAGAGADTNTNTSMHYEGLLRGVFCALDWSSHERDPSVTPMFRDVVSVSQCDKPEYTHTMDLYQVVQAAKLYDKQQQQQQQQQQPNPVVLPLGGVVFHESRCGSTLLANLLQWHNPTENIVYSESPPPITIMSMVSESEEEDDHNNALTANNHALAIQLLQHVMYLMSRRPKSRPLKHRVFFKIQSAGTRAGLALFRNAFPTTPWIFAYRDPIEVMMSHLDPGVAGHGGRNALCVRSQNRPPPSVAAVVAHYDDSTLHGRPRPRRPQDLTPIEYCAAHLASLTEQAVRELESQQQQQQQQQQYDTVPSLLGMALNYRDLPDLFISHVLPRVWNITVDEPSRIRMNAGSTSYSKGRGRAAAVGFVQDSQAKQEHASSEIKQASQLFLQPSYERLQYYATRAKELLLQKRLQVQEDEQ